MFAAAGWSVPDFGDNDASGFSRLQVSTDLITVCYCLCVYSLYLAYRNISTSTKRPVKASFSVVSDFWNALVSTPRYFLKNKNMQNSVPIKSNKQRKNNRSILYEKLLSIWFHLTVSRYVAGILAREYGTTRGEWRCVRSAWGETGSSPVNNTYSWRYICARAFQRSSVDCFRLPESTVPSVGEPAWPETGNTCRNLRWFVVVVVFVGFVKFSLHCCLYRRCLPLLLNTCKGKYQKVHKSRNVRDPNHNRKRLLSFCNNTDLVNLTIIRFKYFRGSAQSVPEICVVCKLCLKETTHPTKHCAVDKTTMPQFILSFTLIFGYAVL